MPRMVENIEDNTIHSSKTDEDKDARVQPSRKINQGNFEKKAFLVTTGCLIKKKYQNNSINDHLRSKMKLAKSLLLCLASTEIQNRIENNGIFVCVNKKELQVKLSMISSGAFQGIQYKNQ